MRRLLEKVFVATISLAFVAGGFFTLFSPDPAQAKKTVFVPHFTVISSTYLNAWQHLQFDGNTTINGHYAKINLTGGANVTGSLPWAMLDLTYGNLHNLPLRNYTGLQGIPRSAGLMKSAANGTLSTAISGTDYAPATSGTSILKGDGSGGTTSAVAGTDYQAAITASGILKGAGGGLVSAAVAGTDYAPATTGISILKGNGSGGFSSALPGTDYLAPTGSGSGLTGITASQVGAKSQSAFGSYSGNQAIVISGALQKSGGLMTGPIHGPEASFSNFSGAFYGPIHNWFNNSTNAAYYLTFTPPNGGIDFLSTSPDIYFNPFNKELYATNIYGTSTVYGGQLYDYGMTMGGMVKALASTGELVTATAGTDYQAPLAIRQRNTAQVTFGNVSGMFFGDGSHLTGIPSQNGGTVTSVSVNTANGFGGTVTNPTTTPAITLTTPVQGLLFGDGTGVSAAAYTSSYLASDVTISPASTFVKGPSVTLAPGTWLVTGYLTLDNTNATYAVVITIRLGDDANNIIGSESQGKLSTSWSTSIGVSQIVTVSGGNETWSLDAAEGNSYAGRYIRATCPVNGTAGKGSYICALRIQ